MLRACRFVPHSYVCLQEEPAISFEGDRGLPSLQATAPPQEEAGAVVAGGPKSPAKRSLHNCVAARSLSATSDRP